MQDSWKKQSPVATRLQKAHLTDMIDVILRGERRKVVFTYNPNAWFDAERFSEREVLS